MKKSDLLIALADLDERTAMGIENLLEHTPQTPLERARLRHGADILRMRAGIATGMARKAAQDEGALEDAA